MPSRQLWTCLIGWGVVAIVSGGVSGCAKSKTSSAAPAMEYAAPAEDSAEEPAAADGFGIAEDLDTLESRLAEVDAALTDAGLAPRVEEEAIATEPAGGVRPEKRVAKASASDSASDPSLQCERICELQAAICDLSDRICALADSHEGEARYADACAGASSRCEQAQGACEACGSD